MMVGFLLATLLATQEGLPGNDMVTAMANQLGYEERVAPCDFRKPEDSKVDLKDVRVAVSSAGVVTFDGEVESAEDVAGTIDRQWLDIHGVCLYLEGPSSAAQSKAIGVILSAASKHSIGYYRFTDPAFTKRVFPKFGRLRQK